MDDLGDVQWIFNKTGGIGDMQALKNNVIKSLKKADGTPVEELNELFINENDFTRKISKWTQQQRVTPKSFLEWLDKPENFNNFFEIAE